MSNFIQDFLIIAEDGQPESFVSSSDIKEAFDAVQINNNKNTVSEVFFYKELKQQLEEKFTEHFHYARQKKSCGYCGLSLTHHE